MVIERKYHLMSMKFILYKLQMVLFKILEYTGTPMLRTVRSWYSYNWIELVKHEIVNKQGHIKCCVLRRLIIYHLKYLILMQLPLYPAPYRSVVHF